MSVKSDSCVSNRNGEPLTEYRTEYEAQQGAYHVKNTYSKHLEPYKCSHCAFWHLSPKDRQTPSSKCPSCVGSDGQCKDLYETQKDAQKRASISHKEKGIRLTVYKCPYNSGWHLTKS